MAVQDYFTNDIYILDEVWVDVDGFILRKWKVIAKIKGFAEPASTQERLIAAQRGVTVLYTIMTDKNISLRFGDKIVVKDPNGETVFLQITTPPQDNRSESAADIISYQAESWANPPAIEGL